MSITIAILDDDKLYQEYLKQEVKKYNETWTIACFDIYEDMQKKRYDAYFIDIELGDHKNGFLIAATLKEQYPQTPIIFISSHENYALDGYHFDAFYFLSKTKMEVHLPYALKKLADYFKINHGEIEVIEKQTKRKLILPHCDILYFLSQGNYVYVETYYEQNYYIRTSITKLKTQLPENFFLIISGIILNIDYIESIDKHNLMVQLKGGKKLRMSRLHYKELIKKLQQRLTV